MAKVMDKAIIANWTALVGKYGAVGANNVDKAVKRLIAADLKRGLATQLVYIDDAARMKALGGKNVAGAADERGAKAAVDAVYAAWTPDYIVLLDGPDVVPHVTLDMLPGLQGDDDLNIPSDLPYATGAGWSRDASKFLAITRVVGRIPAAVGSKSPDAMIKIIDSAAKHSPRAPSDLTAFFGVSADVWKKSTTLSLATTFGAATGLHLSPPDGHPKIDKDLARLSHFINCHGANVDPRFYGQRLDKFPVALDSAKLAPNVKAGTVVAAECCYGAQLYNHTLAGLAAPICMTYLLGGAIGFVGSTNIAYGPAEGNGSADLLTQYFLQKVIEGASLGRALLEARQRFARSQVMASPTNLKTIAQFLLLGDPSLQACRAASTAAPAGSSAKSLTATAGGQIVDERAARKSRRLSLQSAGLAVAAMASRPGAWSTRRSKLSDEVKRLAALRGFGRRPVTVIEAVGTQLLGQAMKLMDADRKVALMVEREETPEGVPFPYIRVLTAHILGDTIVSIEVAERR